MPYTHGQNSGGQHKALSLVEDLKYIALGTGGQVPLSVSVAAAETLELDERPPLVINGRETDGRHSRRISRAKFPCSYGCLVAVFLATGEKVAQAQFLAVVSVGGQA